MLPSAVTAARSQVAPCCHCWFRDLGGLRRTSVRRCSSPSPPSPKPPPSTSGSRFPGRCQSRVVIDGLSDVFRDRRIGDTRFVCTTILPHTPLHGDAVDLHSQTRPRRLGPARSRARHARPPAARLTTCRARHLPKHRPAERSRAPLRPGLPPALHDRRDRARRAAVGQVPRPASGPVR